LDNISGDGGGGSLSLYECGISIGGISFFIFHNIVFKLVFCF
jgi:hypothetical protein